MDSNLLKAATNAQRTIDAIYKWLDVVDEAGGLTCISGVAKANAMFTSLRTQRPRLDKLITEPLMQAIEESKRNG